MYVRHDKLFQCAKGRGIEGFMEKSRIRVDEYHHMVLSHDICKLVSYDIIWISGYGYL